MVSNLHTILPILKYLNLNIFLLLLFYLLHHYIISYQISLFLFIFHLKNHLKFHSKFINREYLEVLSFIKIYISILVFIYLCILSKHHLLIMSVPLNFTLLKMFIWIYKVLSFLFLNILKYLLLTFYSFFLIYIYLIF